VVAGTNVMAVQQMLGHASAAVTFDVYAGLFADDLDVVADQLDRAYEIKCAPNGDYKASKPAQPGRAALRESPE
jgi:hypothetical protein